MCITVYVTHYKCVQSQIIEHFKAPTLDKE